MAVGGGDRESRSDYVRFVPTEILLVAILSAPSGPCVLVATNAPTSELLAALAELRVIREQEERRRVIDAVGQVVWDACATERPVG